jgi:hypothetical protein
VTDRDASAAEGQASPALSRRQVYLRVGLLLFLSNVPLAFLIWLWPKRADLKARIGCGYLTSR